MVSKGAVAHQEVGVVIAPRQPGVVPDINHARIAIALSTVDDHSDNFATVPESILAVKFLGSQIYGVRGVQSSRP